MFETFDPKHLIVKVNEFTIEGFGEQMLTISRPNPMFVQQTGATGHVCRVKTNNLSTDVGFTLQQCSASNDILSAIATVDELRSTGVFKLSINYTPPVGEAKKLLFSSTAYIEKKPDATWANSNQDREWMIKCAQAEYNLGITSTPNHLYPDGDAAS